MAKLCVTHVSQQNLFYCNSINNNLKVFAFFTAYYIRIKRVYYVKILSSKLFFIVSIFILSRTNPFILWLQYLNKNN